MQSHTAHVLHHLKAFPAQIGSKGSTANPAGCAMLNDAGKVFVGGLSADVTQEEISEKVGTLNSVEVLKQTVRVLAVMFAPTPRNHSCGVNTTLSFFAV